MARTLEKSAVVHELRKGFCLLHTSNLEKRVRPWLTEKNYQSSNSKTWWRWEIHNHMVIWTSARLWTRIRPLFLVRHEDYVSKNFFSSIIVSLRFLSLGLSSSVSMSSLKHSVGDYLISRDRLCDLILWTDRLIICFPSFFCVLTFVFDLRDALNCCNDEKAL